MTSCGMADTPQNAAEAEAHQALELDLEGREVGGYEAAAASLSEQRAGKRGRYRTGGAANVLMK